MPSTSGRAKLDPSNFKFSIIIPTDFSDPLIVDLLSSIRESVPNDYPTEIIFVENSSNTDEKTNLVENKKNELADQILDFHKRELGNHNFAVKLVRSDVARGKIPAVLDGIRLSNGENLIIMNDDFTHPPDILPRMMDMLVEKENRMVVASRFAHGGSIDGGSHIRRLVGSGAAVIARYGLKVKHIKDPVSGFIALPKKILAKIAIDKSAYSLSLEILVKSNGLDVREIPYHFKNNSTSRQKFGPSVWGYTRSLVHLYKSGPKSAEKSKEFKFRNSVKFLSKAGRFYTVGASGLFVNFLVSTAISNGTLSNLWYVQATLIGILVSIVSNFLLNKIWTFEDRDFSFGYTIKQFLLFLIISSFGAVVQLVFVYLLVEGGLQYATSLLIAVAVASGGNFLLNKKWTFKDRIWG
ncbi:MAG: GtrA family protein [Candidatus Eiseniibacteriota bacterium]